ncbi:MAG TPA: elongation factor Ts [Epulopiscium sp.]|nr:elongation factor Ts [Candidatus Epulonipiscium sp.]
MVITAKMVKELRERTGSGMMDCKNVLKETDGDIDKAIDLLREKGLATAAKKSGRIAAEGLVKELLSPDFKTAAVVEVNSETDFVAKNVQFIEFVDSVGQLVLDNEIATLEELQALPWINDSSKTVADVLVEMVSTIGEHLTIRRFERLTTNGIFASYTHGGGKIVAVVEIESDVDVAKKQEVGKNIAMQVAAVNPEFISTNDVSDEKKESERAILIAQALNEDPNKPESIIEKMVIGRLNKELKGMCLLEQAYIKDGDLTVKKYVTDELGSEDAIKKILRFETGEGIEKREENFADEVARQMQ